MERLNRQLCDDWTLDRFVTLVLGVLEPATYRMEMVNAGHMYVRALRGAGRRR